MKEPEIPEKMLAVIHELELELDFSIPRFFCKKYNELPWDDFGYTWWVNGWVINLTGIALSERGLKKLSSIPRSIVKAEDFKAINLNANHISSIPSEIVNTSFLRIEHGNLISNTCQVWLLDNPLTEPPYEVYGRGHDAVIEWFKALKEDRLPLNEVKVILVGDGGAGKTSLVKRILSIPFNPSEPQTHGININAWKVKKGEADIKVHLWDFGGQEIMHATHQFFLSKRCLYVLVLDGRKDEKAEYWLKHIESFGGDSPILVVMNKMDENPGFDVNRNFLQRKYKGIRSFHRVSCADGRGIGDLSKALTKELANVELLQTVWARSWFTVKTALEGMTCNYISYGQYYEICQKNGVKEEAAQNTLLDYLHDLGVIIHFRDFELEDTQVLEPDWVTAAVYKIVTSSLLADSNGILKLSRLPAILVKDDKDDPDYPRDKHKYIVDLMKKFEICYSIDGHTVLVPDLLEVQQPDLSDFDFTNALKFVLAYDFLPRSVMPRFIVRMHRDIKKTLRWRTGVVLEDEEFGSTAVVIADNEEKTISIYVSGKQRRDYFAVILFMLRDINSSFQQLGVDERVPMPDDPKVSTSYKHLVRLEEMKQVEFLPEGSERNYRVHDLLGTVRNEKSTEQEILAILRKLASGTESEKSLLEKVNKVIILEPNIFGVGLNINNALNKLLKKKK